MTIAVTTVQNGASLSAQRRLVLNLATTTQGQNITLSGRRVQVCGSGTTDGSRRTDTWDMKLQHRLLCQSDSRCSRLLQRRRRRPLRSCLLVCPCLVVADIVTHVSAASVATTPANTSTTYGAQSCCCQLLLRLLFLYVQSMFSQVDRLTTDNVCTTAL